MFGPSSRLDITAFSGNFELIHPCCHTCSKTIMSESKKSFKVQVHPIIEEIVIEDLDGEETGNDILDKYAALAAKKYIYEEDDIRETLKGVIPFTPVGPAPDGALIVYCGEKADIT